MEMLVAPVVLETLFKLVNRLWLLQPLMSLTLLQIKTLSLSGT
jgi:hypothetical protein